MKRSLQRRLSLMLGSAVLLAGLVAAGASFGLAYLEARELQDDMLRQIAMLPHPSAAATASPEAQNQDVGDQNNSDPESRIIVLQLPHDSQPAWLSGNLAPGFRTITAGVQSLRVFVRQERLGASTVIAQPTDTRNEIAVNSALRTLIPLLLLLPLLAFLIVRIVRNELAPINRLSRTLDEQPADRPQPVADDGLPIEMMPFVDAINRLLKRVVQLMEQQRRFISNAAHELRSPLTALSLQAQNLGNAASPEAMRERMILVQASIERARQLTEQLLNLARMQTDPSQKTVVNVSAITRELIAEYLPLAEAKRIDLGLDETEPLCARTLPERLRIILKNALENAMKYTPNGGVITVRLSESDGGFIIEVIDNGPGIPASERSHVFDPFYRMPSAAGEGSGLGLTIAREAAVALGGAVSLHGRGRQPGLIFRYQQST